MPEPYTTATAPEDFAVVGETIIDGGNTAPVVTFSGTESADCRLAGFTVRGGYNSQQGGGIAGNGTAACISNCIIEQNHSERAGAGIHGCSGEISNCLIRNNATITSGAALTGCHGRIVNCLITGNTALGDGYSAAAFHNCDGLILNCTIADNIAPALLGGITLIRGYDPIDIKHIPYPADLWCAVVHPQLEIKTMDSRKLIPTEVPLKTALQQCGNLAGLVAGLTTNDYGLISRSITDVFAEPYRIQQLPDFELLRKTTLEVGSLGTGLSGSGPSVFSLCRGEDMATIVGGVMKKHFTSKEIEANIYVSKISEAGCRIL